MTEHGAALKGATTKARIIDAAVALGGAGMHKVTARAIGDRLGLSGALVLYHFGDMGKLRQAAIDAALDRKDAPMIARLIMDDNPRVKKMDRATRRYYLGMIGR